MTRKLIVIGAGGHAKVVTDTARACGWDVVGLTDSDRSKSGATILGCPIIGTDEEVEKLLSDEVVLSIGVGEVATRRRLFHLWHERGFTFPALVHPSAYVAESVRMGVGAQIMAGAVIQPDVVLGDNVVVNTSASVDHDCMLADHVFLAPGSCLAGGVTVESGAFIAIGAKVLPNIRIGANAIVAAGAVVVADVADQSTVAGVPARPHIRQKVKTDAV